MNCLQALKAFDEGWKKELDYGDGNVETVCLARDVGTNAYVWGEQLNKVFAYEARTGKLPKSSPPYKYSRTFEWGTSVAQWIPQGIIGSAMLSGFLDRYQVTLAARIDGINKAIHVLADLTQPCNEQLPKALLNVENATALVHKINEVMRAADVSTQGILSSRVQNAKVALADAKTAQQGLEVCVQLVNDFEQIVAPMEKARQAMAGQGFLTKLDVFIRTVDMQTAQDAWKDYSLGEQSLGFLLTIVSCAAIYLAVQNASMSICTNFTSASRRHATVISTITGITAAAYITASGTGSLEAAKIVGTALIINGAAKAIGKCLRSLKALSQSRKLDHPAALE